MRDIVKEIAAEIDAFAGEATEMCRSLVRINTVNPYAGTEPTGFEKAGQDLIKPVLEQMGGRTRLFEPPPDIYGRIGMTGPRDRSWVGRPNLVTEFDFGPGKRIVLNSHMDTVDAANMDFDPFCADIRDGRIYGRGSSDDKGGIVMGIAAIRAVLKFADELNGSIVHQSVVDEECSGSGAGTLACILEGYSGDEAVVIDGHGLTVQRGCQGCLTADVHVKGKGGHAARGGVSSIDKALLIKTAIDGFKAAREAKYPNCLVNLGMFIAGVHPAVVPAAAKLSLNIVYAIAEAAASEESGHGWNGKAVREEFAECLRRAEESDEWLTQHPTEMDWVKDLVPFETPGDAPVVRNMLRAYRAVTGHSASVSILDAWADGANLARYASIPAILFGPGTEGAAHSQHETVNIEDIMTGAKIIAVYLYRQLSRESRQGSHPSRQA